MRGVQPLSSYIHVNRCWCKYAGLRLAPCHVISSPFKIDNVGDDDDDDDIISRSVGLFTWMSGSKLDWFAKRRIMS